MVRAPRAEAQLCPGLYHFKGEGTLKTELIFLGALYKIKVVYVCMYVCVFVCLCVCERERERECVCVCM